MRFLDLKDISERDLELVNPTSPANPDPSSERAWGAALVLIILVMILNLAARLIARIFAPKTGR